MTRVIEALPDGRGRVELSPTSFYWAMLDTSCVAAGRSTLFLSRPDRTASLAYLFEPSLPVSLEEIHAVFAKTPDNRIVACALSKDELRRHLDAGAITLTPAAVPEFLGVSIDPRSINLLTGPFEPVAVRRARHRWLAQTATAMLLGAAVLTIGFERRGAAESRAEAEISAAADAVYAQVLSASGGGGGQPPAARLVGELRSLRQTRADGPLPDTADAGDTLAHVLALWPVGSTAKTDSLVVTPTSVTLGAGVPSHEEAQMLATALGRVEGWSAEQPQVSQARDMVRLTARLTRAFRKGHTP